jgi:cytochrome b561
MPAVSPDRYDAVARLLHWASALLIGLAFVMGLTVDAPPKPWHLAYLNLHVLVGLAIVVIALLRLVWRIGHKPPAPVPGGNPLIERGARLGHAALYAGMIVVPLMGFPPLFSRGLGVNFGLFSIASPMERTKDLIGPTTEAHEIAAYALIAVAVGHALAALWHHFAQHDGVMLRMMPPRKS